MPKFLLVEDSPIVVKIINHLLKEQPSLSCDIANSKEEAEKKLKDNNADTYFAALVDLNLPDAPDGEVVDLCISHKIPTVVLTGNFDEDKRQEIGKKRVVDYIIKESRFSYEYAIKLLNRLHKNKETTILVADDSKMSRKHIVGLLENQLFKVESVDDGDTALEALNKNPDIKMLITDYNMPRMNGFELVKQIRKQVDKNDLVIIGLSADGDSSLSAKFIKNGTNDFLKKPFSNEEFHCRVLHNIENLEFTQAMRHMAQHDYASNLPNKRYFFEAGDKLLKELQSRQAEAHLAIVAIDNLEQLHDEYGIGTSDKIMSDLGEMLPSAFSRFHYARMGDSELAILMSNLRFEQSAKLISGFLERIEDHIMILDGNNVRISASAGLTQVGSQSLLASYKQADNHLYSARNNGGRQLVTD